MTPAEPAKTGHTSTDTTSLRAVAEAFCKHTTATPDAAITALQALTDNTDAWEITFRPPSEHEPHGALMFDHPELHATAGVYISSTDIDTPLRTSDQPVTYDVFNPMETDILTVADDIENPVRAIELAVERANSEHDRFTQNNRTSFISRISNALFA